MSASLLVELFTEELPPKALRRLGDAFSSGMTAALSAATSAWWSAGLWSRPQLHLSIRGRSAS